ncbi:MAG: acyltransferase, partial [Pseudarcicella sp.]|nr:acyltransferase [Pseudarcicella sp.]
MNKLSTQKTPAIRLRELDFLRGIAIILVMLRHSDLSTYVKQLGWIGVDLFFVLSGFLVSGLLFKEYIKFGNIKPKLFLIRRGFKIYPIYFLSFAVYLGPVINTYGFDLEGLISDITFTQNYVRAFGYACSITWSLAIEEHFYFLFTFFLWLGLKNNKNILNPQLNKATKTKFETIIVAIIMFVSIIRLFSNIIFPHETGRNFTMTHLRIDSLLFGVLIAYFFYFKRTILENFFQKTEFYLYFICIVGLVWTPFIDPFTSFFVRTLGFTLLFISFGIVLITFLVKKNINSTLNKLFSNLVVNTIS